MNRSNADQRESQIVKKRVIEAFGMHAKAYVASSVHKEGADLKTLVDGLRPSSHDLALDVATGGGHLANALAPHVRQVVALDLTGPMLVAAKEYARSLSLGNILYVTGDAEALPFADESFEIVTCRIAPHHFPDPHQFIQEVSRVLRPGGRFGLTDNVSPEDPLAAEFINEVERLRDGSHVWCPSIANWQSWIREAGLVCEMEKSWDKTYHFADWVARTAHNREQRTEVELALRGADVRLREQFQIVCDDEEIYSFATTQWLTVCQKPFPKEASTLVQTAVVGLDHVQVAAPPGCEEVARAFYSGLLGLPELPKKAGLATRGGVWFACGGQQLHVGVEQPFQPAQKAHPALAIQGIDRWIRVLQAAGVQMVEDDLSGARRIFLHDPFGNRLELVDIGSCQA